MYHEYFRHRMEDELRFGADHYLKKMLERKSFLESFWGGIKVTCVFMALVSSVHLNVMDKSMVKVEYIR